MKKIFFRNNVILALCITLICITIGFILLSLEWKNEKEKVSSFYVSFTKINTLSSIKGSSIEPNGKIEITNKGQALDMNFILNSASDELSYDAVITNHSSMTAEIIDLIDIPSYQDVDFQKKIAPVEISLSDIIGKVIPAGDSIHLNIKVQYPEKEGMTGKRNIHYKVVLLTKSY